MNLLTPAQAAQIRRGTQLVRIQNRVETVSTVLELQPGDPGLPRDMRASGPWVRIRTVAGNEWFCHPGALHSVLPTRYLGIVEGGLSHATKPDPEIFNGWAPAACNGKLHVSVDHTLDTEPVLAVLGMPLFDVGERAHVLIGDAPDCRRCRRIMGE